MKRMVMAALALLGLLVGTPAMAQTGCGIGVSAGYMMGAVDFGAPVNIGAQGQKVGVMGACDLKMGPAVVGAFGGYEWVLGDMKSIGINHEFNLGARAGLLVQPGTLAYGHVTWARLSTNAGNVDGWKVGPGIEFAVPNTPLAIDLRHSYGMYDDVLNTGLNARTHEVRVGLTYRFSAGSGWAPVK